MARRRNNLAKRAAKKATKLVNSSTSKSFKVPKAVKRRQQPEQAQVSRGNTDLPPIDFSNLSNRSRPLLPPPVLNGDDVPTPLPGPQLFEYDSDFVGSVESDLSSKSESEAGVAAQAHSTYDPGAEGRNMNEHEDDIEVIVYDGEEYLPNSNKGYKARKLLEIQQNVLQRAEEWLYDGLIPRNNMGAIKPEMEWNLKLLNALAEISERVDLPRIEIMIALRKAVKNRKDRGDFTTDHLTAGCATDFLDRFKARQYQEQLAARREA